MRNRSLLRRAAIVVGALFVAGALWPLVAAAPPAVTVEIGQPSIWSLAQAHYLLANMHQENRGLKVPMPTTELNPKANGPPFAPEALRRGLAGA